MSIKKTICLLLCLNMLMVHGIPLVESDSTLSQDTKTSYHYHFCKVWGFLKYHHTSIAAGYVNWDDQLLIALEQLDNCNADIEFNSILDTFINSAGVMGVNSTELPSIPDSLMFSRDFTWMTNHIFDTNNQNRLTDVLDKFRPQSNVYVDNDYNQNPDFSNDNLYYESGSSFPNEHLRLLALFRYWNVIDYFYPYKNLIDQSWDQTLLEFIPQIVSCKSLEEYHLLFYKITKHINDSHGFVLSNFINNWRGNYWTPFLVKSIDDKLVVTKVHPSVTEVSPGDWIKKIDGYSINFLKDSLSIYAYGSNPKQADKSINLLIVRGDEGEFDLIIENDQGIKNLTLVRGDYIDELYFVNEPAWTISNHKGMNIAYVHMFQLESHQVFEMFEEINSVDAIIFDLRFFPNGTLWEIVNHLYRNSIKISSLLIPNAKYPGTFSWTTDIIGHGTSDPYYEDIILLISENTYSQGEYTCMGIERHHSTIKIGNPTAGTDGDISLVYLPGGIKVFFSGLGVYYPDYRQTQRVGIIPDIEVNQTIKGIKEGRDEIKDAAYSVLLGNEDDYHVINNYIIYPNPTSGNLMIKNPSGNELTVFIYDNMANLIQSLIINSTKEKIDVSHLNQGSYIAVLKSNGLISAYKFIKTN